MRVTARPYQRIDEQLAQLAELCRPERFALAAERVSGWSVGEHVQHLVLADVSILGAMESSLGGTAEGVLERGSPTLVGKLVLWTGRIPRGRGKAPAGVLPRGLQAAGVAAELGPLGERLRALSARHQELRRCSRTVAHPLLGRFAPRHWLRFVDVHHRHHLAIVADIERACGS